MNPANYPEEKNLNDRSKLAIKLFHEIAQGARIHGWQISFLTGFAIDAHFGYLTKNHKDVDIIISKDEAKQLTTYLTTLGHTVFEVEDTKGECLKVDHADPERPSQALADLHYFWEEDGKVVIPLKGKKLVFSGSFSEMTESRKLLGEDITVLKPHYLLEEKKGWCEQVGLSQCREKPELYQADIDKITFLL
ncbi:MAG: hypothetical protein AAB483_00955 [Patescibacteria group bacterium]|mgnify:FL=1